MNKFCRSNLTWDSCHVNRGRMRQLQHITLLAGLVVLFGASPSSAAGHVFDCDSSTLELTVNMNFGEWFDNNGNRGEVRFGKKPNTYQIDYKGTAAFLTHRGKKSKLMFPDGRIIPLSCSEGGSGQTPGE